MYSCQEQISQIVFISSNFFQMGLCILNTYTIGIQIIVKSHLMYGLLFIMVGAMCKVPNLFFAIGYF